MSDLDWADWFGEYQFFSSLFLVPDRMERGPIGCQKKKKKKETCKNALGSGRPAKPKPAATVKY